MEYNKLMVDACKKNTVLRGYMLLQEIEEKRDKNGNPYCELVLADGVSSLRSKVWKKAAAELGYEVPAVVKVEIATKEYMGRPDHCINQHRAAEPECPFTLRDFVRTAPLEPEFMFEAILEALHRSVGGQTAGTLAELAERIYRERRGQLLTWSAAEAVHHDMLAGLLYHTYRMMQQAEAMVKIYDSLNAELLCAGVALHDIGKLDELMTDALGISTYSVDGRLFGHAVLGIEAVDRMVAQGNYDEEKVRCLKHCIASHHGRPEWGALSVPKIQEASVLHYIDHLDGDLHQYEKAHAITPAGELTAKKIFGLENVKIYKPSFK